MPRKSRELVDGGIYHVYSRGNNFQKLYRQREDCQIFLQLIQKTKTTFLFDVFHYCLMPNHYHLLLKIMRGDDLPRIMHSVLLSYTRYYKKAYGFKGHVFASRFRSPLIQEESYYLQCGRYIERNPVKAGIVKDVWEYECSSAGHYAFGRRDDLITDNPYYLQTGRTLEERQNAYRKFVSLEEPYDEMINKGLNG